MICAHAIILNEPSSTLLERFIQKCDSCSSLASRILDRLEGLIASGEEEENGEGEAEGDIEVDVRSVGQKTKETDTVMKRSDSEEEESEEDSESEESSEEESEEESDEDTGEEGDE